MANINMWKTVFQRNVKLFDKYYPEFNKFSEIDRSRYGFYLFILGSMFDIENRQEFEKYIIDSNFNKKILGGQGNDNKVDCIYIDDEDKKIYIMNFKYREKFKENKNFDYDEVDSTVNFLALIMDSNYNPKNLNNKKLGGFFSEIREIINDTAQIYDIYFYFISNEDKPFSSEILPRIECLERDKGVSIKQVALEDAYNIGNKKVEATNAKLLIEVDRTAIFNNDSYATNNSYIMNISLFELLRITCNNQRYRESRELKSSDNFDLTDFIQEKSQLRDNVRSYLGLTDYNKNIKKTLKEDVNNFFYYNNGITIVCNQISAEEIKSNKLYSIELNDIQIVNGGQTISTLFKVVEEKEISDLLYKLKNTYILIRVFNIARNDELRLNIAQYTNSQNAIDKIDLKSVDKIQLDIEEYFKTFGVDYIRKRGTVSDNNESIKMITLAQIIYSFKGYPDRASNQKKRLFDEYYEYIFLKDFDVDSCKKLYLIYKLVLGFYDKRGKKYELSEIYYVMYLLSKKYKQFISLSINGLGDISENIVEKISCFIEINAIEYTQKQDNKFAVSRAYIKKDFREQIDINFKFEQLFN